MISGQLFGMAPSIKRPWHEHLHLRRCSLWACVEAYPASTGRVLFSRGTCWWNDFCYLGSA